MILKKTLFLPVIVLLLASCSSVKVATDYDTSANFNQFKTFAFYKKGIDKASISNLDKKRIMRAVESELTARGMTKSKTPDLLVSLFTKSRERVTVTDNNFGYGYGYGWSPWMWGGANSFDVSQYTEGTLFIDVIDAKKKALVWQGIGTGALRMKNAEKKEARINKFVAEILEKYPLQKDKK